MPPNPILKRLGFDDRQRLVIIHADDIGMCQASVSAFEDLWKRGLVSSGSVMMPCPWSPATGALCQRYPDVDMGVHLTLTSEWDTYRWGPTSTREPRSGMIDGSGFFFRSVSEARERGDPRYVERELETQVDQALAHGITPTHIDTHMGVIAHPKFISLYVGLAARYRLVPMLLRSQEAGWRKLRLDAETAAVATKISRQWESEGMPMLDCLSGLESQRAGSLGERIAYAKEVLDAVPAGLTHFIIHPATDTPELRAAASDWPRRVGDYRAFMSEELRDYMARSDLHVMNYRTLQKLLP